MNDLHNALHSLNHGNINHPLQCHDLCRLVTLTAPCVQRRQPQLKDAQRITFLPLATIFVMRFVLCTLVEGATPPAAKVAQKHAFHIQDMQGSTIHMFHTNAFTDHDS